MKSIVAVITLISLAACSTPAPQAEAIAKQDPNVNCEITYVTGSAMPKKRCETLEEKERQRKLARETGDVLSKAVIIQEKPGGIK